MPYRLIKALDQLMQSEIADFNRQSLSTFAPNTPDHVLEMTDKIEKLIRVAFNSGSLPSPRQRAILAQSGYTVEETTPHFSGRKQFVLKTPKGDLVYS